MDNVRAEATPTTTSFAFLDTLVDVRGCTPKAPDSIQGVCGVSVEYLCQMSPRSEQMSG